MYDLGNQFHINSSNLKAKQTSVVQGKNFRFTVLTERLIRLEYSSSGVFNDYQTQLVSFRNFDTPSFERNESSSYIQIKTSYFTLSYARDMPFKGSSLNSMKNLKVQLNGTNNVWYYGHPEARNYYGSSVSIESNNSSYENRGLYSIEGFVSLDDSDSLKLDENGTIVNENSSEIDIYLFMYNTDFGYCLQDYLRLTGNPSMVPRYVLGNWWSKNTEYSSTDLEELMGEFKSNDIPISVLLLDKGWHLPDASFTFNNVLFPDPKTFINNMHMDGIRVGVNIDPSNGISSKEKHYQEIISKIPVNQGSSVEFDPLNPVFLDSYFKYCVHPLEELGVDFFWNDYSNISDLKTMWIINHYHYLDLGRKPDKREMILSRNALKASHRYPVLYSGNTKVSWDNFKQLPFFNISSANIGVCWWSHDVGGYYGGIEEDDLYIRSVQLGVFSPILRFHSDEGRFYKKEPWKWDYKTKSIVGDYLRLRHKLVSYLYSEAYRYYKKGKVVFQPVYYMSPAIYDDVLYRNEYFFGSELLVAPIINKREPLINRTIHRLYLPEGIWYDYTTGKKFIGNKKYVAFFKDEDYPIFARQGSIIPLSLKSNVNNTSNPTDLEIQIFPGKSNTFELYEDDGISSLYKQGYYLLTSIDYNYMPSNYTVIIRPIEGKSKIVPDYRNYKIRFRNTKKANEVVTYFGNGVKIENNSYVEGNDFIVEVNNVQTIGQLTVNCKGKNIEIDAVRLINEEIDSILMDLLIETEMKENIAKILYSSDPLSKKRIELRKLKRKNLDKSFINLFLKLLEYIEQI